MLTTTAQNQAHTLRKAHLCDLARTCCSYHLRRTRRPLGMATQESPERWIRLAGRVPPSGLAAHLAAHGRSS
eukprot:3768401-Prymnesium_polylepis.1